MNQNFNLFILESPLQVDNAKRIKNNSESESFFLIRKNGEKDNDELLDNALIGVDNTKFITIRQSNVYDLVFGYFYTLFYLLFKVKKVGKLWIGDIRSPILRTLAYTLAPRGVNVIDDGLATITVINKLEDKIKRSFFKKFLIYFCPTFYTSFSVNPGFLKVVRLVDNPPNSERQVGNEVIIVGSPLVDKGIIKLDDWIRFIREILTDLSSAQVVHYFPHRAESSVYIKHMESYFPSVNFVLPECNLESYLSSLEKEPLTVVSFFSTVLITAQNYLLKSDIVSYKIPNENILPPHRENIHEVYSYLSKVSRLTIKSLS